MRPTSFVGQSCLADAAGPGPNTVGVTVGGCKWIFRKVQTDCHPANFTAMPAEDMASPTFFAGIPNNLIGTTYPIHYVLPPKPSGLPMVLVGLPASLKGTPG
jgi:hypothetical protein